MLSFETDKEKIFLITFVLNSRGFVILVPKRSKINKSPLLKTYLHRTTMKLSTNYYSK